MSQLSFGSRLRRLAAIAFVALACGCALDGTLIDPIGGGWPPIEDDGSPRAYDEGYQRGWRDRERGRAPDHTRHEENYDVYSERAFRSGYADGYQRRAHRYGDVGPRVSAAVPDWIVGAFRGWDDDGEVELRVRRDGSATLALDGRAYRGEYRGGRLFLRNGAWRVQRMRGGVVVAPEEDPGSVIRLARAD